MRTISYSLLLSLLLPVAASAESMRCGKWVVNETVAPAELLAKCGEPQRKEEQTSDVYGLNAAGRSIKTGTTVTQRWFYQPTPGALPRVVTIVDGKIRRIERTE